MFKRLSTKLLQHLTAQNAWSASILKPYAGKSVLIDFALFDMALVILENGNLATAGETNIADATVTIPPSLLPRLLAKDESSKLKIQIEGDAELATTLAKVFAEMRWDYEDDLSKLVGDVPAFNISEAARHSSRTIKQTTVNLAEMLSEYWQEEQPILAKKRHIEQFNNDVDNLRADVERLEKRLNKLITAIAASSDTIQSLN
jgi:ubiquinone biosynthesis protein UbiJ